MFQKISRILICLFLVACMISFAMPVQAKVSAEEAARLKKDLTPVGAERAGNAEGTIPAWEGGLATIPDNVTFDPAGTALRPDPFADDKVLFTITAQNMNEYADQLTPGLKEMFRKYPDTWKMHVYPTRRSFAAPQSLYDNTFKNAVEAELVGDGSDGFTGAFGGFPFPIPQNGAEVIMNHQVRYAGKGFVRANAAYLVYADGSRDTTGAAVTTARQPYFIGNREDYDDYGFAIGILIQFTEPARRKGEILLSRDRSNYSKGTRGVWQYMPGQRRVRRAPSIAYDTPSPSYGGYGTYDDSFMYNGQIDRYNWKSLGKKEMFLPYNCYQFELAPLDDLLTPLHPDPKFIRWELHRAWGVDATLKEGTRHCYGRRTIYLDEDCWTGLLGDNYDTRGNLWRTKIVTTKQMYDIPAMFNMSSIFKDFQVDTYVASSLPQGYPIFKLADTPEEFMTPQNVRKLGKR